MATVEQQEP